MKMKYKVILTILGSVVLLGSGVLLGGYLTEKRIQEIEGNYFTTTKIAVVNLDEGVDYGGEHRNFANELVTAQKQELLLTGLNDAKAGIENGTYGAYLIIPADFSTNVTTINSQPKKSLLKYEINGNLSNTAKDKVTLDLMELNDSLNDDLGYMYLHSVFNELHNGQDSALKVLSNDDKDKETIMAISNMDLVQSLDLKELERLENNIENLDVSEDFEMNKQLIDTIDTAYKGYLGKLDEDTSALINESNEVHKVFGMIGVTIPSLPTIQNEDGSNNYTFDKTNQVIAQENKKILDSISQLSGRLLLAETKNTKEVDELLSASNIFIEKTKSKNQEILDGNKFDELKEEIEADKDSISIDDFSYAKGIFDKLKKQLATQKEINKGLTAEKNIEKFISDKYSFYAISESDNEEILRMIFEDGANDTNIQNSILNYADVNKQPDIIDLETYYTYTRGTQAMPLSESSDLDSEITDADLEGAFKEDLSTFVNKNIKERITDYAKDYPKVIEEDDINRYEQLINEMKVPDFNSISKDLDQISGVDEMNITNHVVSDLSKLAKNQLDFKTSLNKEMDKALGYSNEFLNQINPYDPLKYIDGREIEGFVLDYQYNNASIESKINSKDREYKSFMDETYMVANQHVSSLQKDIFDYQKLSDEKLEKGLEKAKSVKSLTSSDNRILMTDFINTLPYSRLGSAENTSTYQFMINPINKETTILAGYAAIGIEDMDSYLIIMLAVAFIGMIFIGCIAKFSSKPSSDKSI